MAIQSNFPALKPSLLLDFANTKQLDSRITYTRASTASFYNGVSTAKAEQNLATYSQQFDNAAWLKENSSITADSTTAPDGTTTADSLIESSANGPHGTYTALLSVTTASTVTVSIYAKQNTKRYIVLGSTDGFANYPVLFDLQSGVVVGNATGYPAYSAPTSSSITSVGSSWYRLTVTLAINGAASSARVIAYLTDDSGSVSTGFSYTGNGTSSAYIWGAQLEQRSAVSAYTATTTQAITNYIPVLQTAASGVARFDNNPTTGESLGLLIEESRTNLLTYSEQFDNAAWTKQANITITANTNVSPDGTLTADTWTSASSTVNNGFYALTTGSNSTAYTSSIYAKLGSATTIRFGLTTNGETATAYYDFNLSAGTSASGAVTGFTSTSATMTAVGNGWYRCSVSGTTPSSGVTQIGIFSRLFTIGFVFIWGTQVEAGAFATSYIPTVASQVTRAADAASMTGTNFSSWYNYSEGTMYADGVTASAFGSSNQMIASIGDGSSSQNQVSMYRSGSAALTQLITSSGATQSNLSSGLTATPSTNYKFITCYKVNDFAFSVNANTVQTDSSGLVPAVVNKLDIGNWHVNGTGNWNSTIKKIAYYPLRVTNAQLQSLTS